MTTASILTRRRPRPASAPQQNEPEPPSVNGPEPAPDPAAIRLQQLNQVEAALAHAARLLEQAQPEEYIPDYDQSRQQTLQELDKTRQTLGTKIYRLQTCRQVQTNNGAAAAAAVPAAEKPLRDCQS